MLVPQVRPVHPVPIGFQWNYTTVLNLVFLVAGFLAVLVPTAVWNILFFRGHGAWTSVENVIVGPLIAVISFVCSIGNVPLAAALWTGGISFGGVISFVFADLITLPLILIYRKFYGWALTWRLVVAFWIDPVCGMQVEMALAPAQATRHNQRVHFCSDHSSLRSMVRSAIV